MPNTIMTKCGQIQGTSCRWEGVTAYKGIRYATAGRWEYPACVTHWDGIYDATQYGHCSYQPRAFRDESKIKERAFYHNEFRKDVAFTYDDDCLFLNIWTPSVATTASALPVIVYIHGGAFTGGCGHEKPFDDPVWPTKGVIAVTINYRLGPMGLMSLPALAEEAGHAGNYMVYDQIAALTWVRDHIREFGGDPDNITVMGQSSGAMSVQILCDSPKTDGLFAKAVMNSGGGVGKFVNTKHTVQDQFTFWEKVMKTAGCTSLHEMRELEADQLFHAWQCVSEAEKKGILPPSPGIDGIVLTEPPMETVKRGAWKNIPYMIGSTSEDMYPPVLNRMAINWCVTQDEWKKQPGYCWLFDRKLPGDDKGAWHSSELWYFFGTLKNCWRPFTEHDFRISDAIVEALCSFAKTGNPNAEGSSLWEPTTKKQKKIMIFGEEMPHMAKTPTSKLAWNML